jgi:hypothetical protein
MLWLQSPSEARHQGRLGSRIGSTLPGVEASTMQKPASGEHLALIASPPVAAHVFDPAPTFLFIGECETV